MTTRFELVTATAGDFEAIKALLAAANLPHEDLDVQHIDQFIACRENGELLAAGAVERYGREGLLRSVVVSEAARGRGLGVAITGELEARAKAAGLETLYLLTTTAPDFFPRLGYEVFDRAHAPSAIAQSTEFATLCPASAVCMRKVLA